MNDITIRDQFEWDLNADESLSSPELFARALCADLGLCREFQVAIAHSIREQITTYRKLVVIGDYKERPVVTKALRPTLDTPNWTPIVGPKTKLAEQFQPQR